jgi:predicted nucleic acid-binding protein
MKIYLDVCCFNRPFDDQSQERIRLEAEAVLLILQRCEQGELRLVGSNVITTEIEQCPDPQRRERVRMAASEIEEMVNLGSMQVTRARELERKGFRAMDSLHLACAESAKVDAFLATDDQLLRQSHRHNRVLRVTVENPLNWLANWGKK